MVIKNSSIYLLGTSRSTEERTGSYKNTMWTSREREKWHTTAETCLFGHFIKQDYSFRGLWFLSSTLLTNKKVKKSKKDFKESKLGWAVNNILEHWQLLIVKKLQLEVEVLNDGKKCTENRIFKSWPSWFVFSRYLWLTGLAELNLQLYRLITVNKIIFCYHL